MSYDLDAVAERRRLPRTAWQMPCEVLVGSRRAPGTVLNFSLDELFATLPGDLARGCRAEVKLDMPLGTPDLTLRTLVRGRRRLHPRWHSPGVAEGYRLRILEAPAAFAELIDDAGWKPRAPRRELANSEASDRRTYRVRVQQFGTTAFRMLRVEGRSAADVRKRLEKALGAGWVVDLRAENWSE